MNWKLRNPGDMGNPRVTNLQTLCYLFYRTSGNFQASKFHGQGQAMNYTSSLLNGYIGNNFLAICQGMMPYLPTNISFKLIF